MNNYCTNIRMKTIFMNTENRKMNEPYKSVPNLSQTLNTDTHVALLNLSIQYTLKNIRKKCKNNKLKIIAPTWNVEFELPDGYYSVSDIQDYIEYIIKNIKKHETLTKIPPIHIYINRINNRLVQKLKARYKPLLELQTPETTKLLVAQKN